MMQIKKSREQGYFLIIAVLFILVMGVLGSLIVSLTSSRAMLSASQRNGLQAFYIAESGLDITTHYLTRLNFNSPARLACSGVNGHAQLTNESLDNGTFTAITINSSPVYSIDTLNGAVTASASTINAVSTAGFAPTGRIIIDREAIDYAAISGNSFIGITRGTGGTFASSHPNGSGISQYQCSLDVQAGIPNLTSPTFKRELQWNVQLQDGYAVGDRQGNNDTIINWNRVSELDWSNTSIAAGSSNRGNLNAVSMLSSASGWAVGEQVSAGFVFARWNGATWTLNILSGACSNQDLFGVSMVSSSQGFAVGARYRPGCASSGNFRYTILRWNGSAWSLLTPATSPSIPADSSSLQNLNAVNVIDTNGDGVGNIGFAVGDNGTILRYNGSNWVANTSPTTQDLNGVYTVSNSEAWAVGQGGVILRWNGTAWSSFSSPTTTTLNAISMLDTNNDGLADFGFAVGSSARILTYNGSTWSSVDIGGNNLFSVDIFNTNDAWTVGSSGVAFHWDGTSWTSVPSTTTRQLNGISLVRTGSPPVSVWRQIFR